MTLLCPIVTYEFQPLWQPLQAENLPSIVPMGTMMSWV